MAVGTTPASLGSIDRYATPDTIPADKTWQVNPHGSVTFRDATKTSIEWIQPTLVAGR